MFRFKQFNVDQSNCAMKINTDGVLLGALAAVNNAKTILDIGTGTGVIALMLAQRFIIAKIDAVEIDEAAAQTAKLNFENSPFAERLHIYPIGFEDFFTGYPNKKYDLIVSNPPFHINSLESPGAKKSLAKHADEKFFEVLINTAASHLTASGLLWLVLPLQTAELVKALTHGKLFLHSVVQVHSFTHSAPHREIVCFGLNEVLTEISNLDIYKSIGNYTAEYMELLKPYFIAF